MEIVKRSEKLVIDNSPAILTAMGVVGTVTTAVFAAKAGYKAAEIIDTIESVEGAADRGWPRLREHTQLTWKFYIPAVGMGTATIACIIGANTIGTRRAAALAAAYSLSEKAFSEYKEKIVDTLGVQKEQQARDELAQERVDRNPSGAREVIIAGGVDVLCYDAFTGRYFQSSMEALKKAQNDTNYQINNNYYASLSDFYDKVGLSKTSYSDEVGWNCNKLLELEFSTVLSEDGKPCISVNFAVEPIRHYYRVQ